MTDGDPGDQWMEERTTFERVYDTVVGAQSYLAASEFAERARCSTTAARKSLEQLAEMGIADRRAGRPTTYRRNHAYFEWKRIESLASEHDSDVLRERIGSLIAADESFQEAFGVPEPDAVTMDEVPFDDHERLEERWEDLNEWRSVRRDIRVLRRAVERSDRVVDDGAVV